MIPSTDPIASPPMFLSTPIVSSPNSEFISSSNNEFSEHTLSIDPSSHKESYMSSLYPIDYPTQITEEKSLQDRTIKQTLMKGFMTQEEVCLRDIFFDCGDEYPAKRRRTDSDSTPLSLPQKLLLTPQDDPIQLTTITSAKHKKQLVEILTNPTAIHGISWRVLHDCCCDLLPNIDSKILLNFTRRMIGTLRRLQRVFRPERIHPSTSVIDKIYSTFFISSSEYRKWIQAYYIFYISTIINNQKLAKHYDTYLGKEKTIHVLLSHNIVNATEVKINGMTHEDKSQTSTIAILRSVIMTDKCFFKNINAVLRNTLIIAKEIIFYEPTDFRDCIVIADTITFHSSFKSNRSLIVAKEKLFVPNQTCIHNIKDNQSLIKFQEIVLLQEPETHNPNLQTLQVSEPFKHFETLKKSIQSLECLPTFPKESFESFLPRTIYTKKDREDPRYIQFESIRAKLSESIDSIDTETLKALLEKFQQLRKITAKDAIQIPSLISHFLQELLVKSFTIKDGTQPNEQSVKNLVTLIEFTQENFPNIFGDIFYSSFFRACWMHRAIMYDSLLRKNSISMLEKVIAPDAISDSDRAHNNPLHYAAILGNDTAIQFILQKIKEKNEIRPVSIRTSENEEYIIEKSPSPCSCYVKQGNKEGYTPLHFAVMSGSKECVELLLAEGADYSERNVDNETSLDIAIKHNHQEIIQILNDLEMKLKKIQDFIIPTSIDWCTPLTEEEEKQFAAIMLT